MTLLLRRRMLSKQKKPAEETFMTTLYTDGTFIMNEKASDRDANIALYGAVDTEWEPLSYDNPYEFVNATKRPWNSKSSSVKSVKFGSEVKPTSMLAWFSGFTQVTDFDFTNLDTSNCKNMSSIFSNCSSLTSLDVSSFDTSNTLYMNSMFWGCSQLSSLDLSNFNTSKVTEMSSMFYGCWKLIDLDISSFNTSNVTNMWSMFNGIAKNTYSRINLDLSHFDTSRVTNMSDMFNKAYISNFNIEHWNVSKVTNMERMFQECAFSNSTNTLDLSHWQTDSLTKMSYMFNDFKLYMGHLDVSNFDTSKITDMTWVFKGSTVKTINVDNWDTSNVTSMNAMFNNLNWVESLNLSSFNVNKVTDMHSIVGNNKRLLEVTLFDMDTSFINSINNTAMFTYDNALQKVIIGGTNVMPGDRANFFYGVPITCEFYVPVSLVDSYKAANGWAGKANYIFART